MKRRVISIITALALSLSLCPTGALAIDAEPDTGLCPHHRAHTEECGYVPPAPGQDCAHEHNEGCFQTEAQCVHQHTEACYPASGADWDSGSGLDGLEPSLCTHECSEAGGCVTLAPACPHIHDGACGYAAEDDGVPCAFVCRLCPIKDLIDQLPYSVTQDNRNRTEEQLKTILALYTGLTAEEQDQLDLSRCFGLQAQLDAANAPAPASQPCMKLEKDSLVGKPLNVSGSLLFDTANYSFTASKTSAISVQSTGKLSLQGSVITSQNGAGVEVLAGGSLSVADTGLTVSGTTYGLDIASGTVVELSGGTFTGGIAAIRTADGNFNALLKEGYAYFDEADNPIPAADMAAAKTVVIKIDKKAPDIKWGDDIPVPVQANYDGSPVEKTDLPAVIITANGEAVDLSQYLQYFYKKQNDSTYTEGLPTNAGTYDVMVSLPGTLEYYQAASSAPITLIINKINPVKNAPAAINPVYNGAAQALVTAGSVWDGAVIEFAQDETGPYSTDIPIGINAGSYPVWYRVEETENYSGVLQEITGVSIVPKNITPKIELSQTSYVYDGSKKEPKITVKDETTELDNSQYEVVWDNNQTDVGTHKLTVQAVSGANYTFTGDRTASIEIVPAVQDGLKITGKPSVVYYGDTITSLDTVGGSGNGSVKWTLSGGTSSQIDSATGVLEVTEMATLTVKAERTVSNYGTVEDTWTFTVQPKPVTAEVTVAPKAYDGGSTIAPGNITAYVNPSDLVNSGDNITISGLTGAYDDVNAGTNKTVTLNPATAIVSGTDKDKYSVSFPAAAVADIRQKEINVAVTLSGDGVEMNPVDGKYYADYDGSAKTPAVTVTEQSGGAPIPANDYTVSYSGNKNAGIAAVTVGSRADGNYIFSNGPVTVNFTIREAEAILTSSPQARNLTFNGQAQDLVTVGAASGGKVYYSSQQAGPYEERIPQGTNAGTYTVYYKVEGGANHQGSTNVWSMSVTIKPKEIISPIITVSPNSFPYTGRAQTPTTVTVQDNGTTILGSEYTVSYSNNVDAGTATVHIINKNGGNYIVNGSAAFEITKGTAGFTTPPQGNAGLAYDGTAQPLVTAGVPEGGTAVYSLDDVTYSTAIPTKIDVGTYTVYAKVRGDENHMDSASTPISVSIGVNNVTSPTISLSSTTFQYNGSEQKPEVKVLDGKGNEIPANEYTVAYKGDTVKAGSYTIQIEGKGIRYSFSEERTVTILPADQTALTITGKPNVVYYGDTIQLGTTGGTGSGTVAWKVVSGSATLGGSDGQFIITGTGSIKIEAVRTPETGSSYAPVKDEWEFYAYPKPVTAVVTAADKEYDNSNAAVLTVTVPGTNITITNVTGTFEDENVGTNKTVHINHSSANVTNGDNYVITYPDTTRASITPAPATVDDVTWASGLTYTGRRQNLVASCSVTGGNAAYSLNGADYDLNIPTAIDAGTYRVWCKVLGSGNYKDSEPIYQDVSIGVKQISNPEVVCSPGRFSYDRTAKTPTVIVKDNEGRAISESEYTVEFSSDDRVEVGSYTVTVTAKPGGNYTFAPATGNFEIVKADQNPLSIVLDKSTNIYYGDKFKLSVTGGFGSGKVQWSVSDKTVAGITDDGMITVAGVGSFTVTAYKEADGSYADSNTDSVTFYADPKPITLVVTAADKSYNGTTAADVSASWRSGDLVTGDQIGVAVTGEFLSPDAGTSKQVKIKAEFSGDDVAKYDITCPGSTTASIHMVDATQSSPPTAATGLVYTGSEQQLLTSGAVMVDGIGVVEYSLSETGGYSSQLPKAVNAGTYTVWYRVENSVNYMGFGPRPISVMIGKKPTSISSPPTVVGVLTAGQSLNELTLSGGSEADGVPGSFTWENGGITPDVGETEQTVVFIPADSVNYESSTTTVKVTVNAAPSGGSSPDGSTPGGSSPDGSSSDGSTSDGSSSGSGTSGSTGGGSTSSGTSTGGAPAVSAPSAVSAPMQTSVQNGAAKTVVNTAGGDKLIREAVANHSEAVVIKPEITSGVTKAEVSIPASTVGRIQSETKANLTVSTPVADVTIPNAALNTLSSAGGAVSVATEQVENAVTLTLTAGGKSVESVPGGLMLTVPVADARPGTVAVLVRGDGTRETIRKAVPEGSTLSVPLSGSATVEIVDNSKEFTDVPTTDWAADAVAFASAHELFDGTSETTFSPEESMTRAMLATVLYNLEGRPARSLASEFSDVDSGAWYAAGVSWATENGITNGYGGETFGPNDSVTREQFAVMLWRYAGSPAASGSALSFVDANQASSYAIEALCWAAENGVLNGHDDGRLDPDGLATRAQAAQMLKNFMENI